MGVIDVNTDPSTRQLRQFGLLWLFFLGLLGAFSWFKAGLPPMAVVLWILAVAVPAVGWFSPRFLRLVFVGMSYAAFPVGFVVSHVVLAVVFYGVLTPIGLMMRIFGYDSMKRRFDADTDSYWVERDPSGTEPKRYFRQF